MWNICLFQWLLLCYPSTTHIKTIFCFFLKCTYKHLFFRHPFLVRRSNPAAVMIITNTVSFLFKSDGLSDLESCPHFSQLSQLIILQDKEHCHLFSVLYVNSRLFLPVTLKLLTSKCYYLHLFFVFIFGS